MTTLDLALPLPYYSSFHPHTSYKISYYRRAEIPFFLHVDVNAALVHHTTSPLVAVYGKTLRKPKQKPQTDDVNVPCIAPHSNTNEIVSLLQYCTTMKELMQLHAHILKHRGNQSIFLCTKLVNMYALWGNLDNARLVFDKKLKRNMFLWNAIVKAYAKHGVHEEILMLYYQMLQEGIQPDNFTFPFVLKACAGLSALQEGKEIHCHIVKVGFDSDVFVGAALVHMYAKCGSIVYGRHVFDRMSERDAVSYTSMISGYTQNGHANEALMLFNQMQLAEVTIDSITIVSVLQACSHLRALKEGKEIHNHMIRTGLDSDVFVETVLMHMYAKCGSINIARQVFDKISMRSMVSWSAMIAGYAQSGHASEALALFNRMQRAEVTPDSITIVSALQACAHLAALQQGKWIHDHFVTTRLESDVFVGTALIDMYAKCMSVEVARQLFDRLPERNVVSWSAMIAGYAQSGHVNEALTLFHEMQFTNVIPNSVTIVSVLQACTHLTSLKQGRWIHGCIIRRGFETDVFVMTALIDMYAKCGNVELARHLFDKMPTKNVVSWSAMIAGYGIHGQGENALALFNTMQQTGMKPNHITFVSILSACSHAGLVDEGCQYFESMIRNYRFTPRMEHYACMVDLLGRAGHLDEARGFIEKMPLQPGVSVWGALLGACRIHCDVELGELVAGRLFDLEPQKAGYYILLSNIYAAAGRWDDVEKVRTMMNERGVKTTKGCSSIEVNNTIHTFLVGDRSHPQSEKIYAMLETLAGKMEKAGYVPNTNFVLHDVEEEVKEHMLYSHSEKLAIAFGLINTNSKTPIRIVKNLRICGDCHSATKFISKIVKREIIMRDVNRFHHFKDGLCSCGDYW
eukprot:Gb_11389 [translate_table: standard]